MEENDLQFDEEFLTDITDDKHYIITNDCCLRKLDRSTDYRLLNWLLNGTQKVIKITPELLPCPFCGGKAKLINTGYNVFYVDCNNCDCSMTCETPTCETKKEAIDLWNTRYVPQD